MQKIDDVWYFDDNEVVRIKECLERTEPGTEEYQRLLENLNSVNEMKESQVRLMFDLDEKKEDSSRKNKESFLGVLKIGTEVGLGVAGLLLYRTLFREGIRYERDGIVASNTVRNFFGSIKPPKLFR